MNLLNVRRASASRLLIALNLGVFGLLLLAFARAGESTYYWLSWRAFILTVACLVPSYVHLAQLRRDPENAEPLPLLPIIGVIYGIFFGLPLLLRTHPKFMRAVPDVQSLSSAVNVTLAGWCALLIGYYGLGAIGKIRQQGHFRMNSERASRLAWPLIIVGFLCHVIWRAGIAPGALAQPVLILSWLLQIGVGIGLLLALRGHLTGVGRSAIYLLGVPSLFAVRLGENGIGAFVYPGLYVMLLVWAVRSSLPWRYAVPALLGLVLIKGGVAQYRMALAAGGEGSMSELEQGTLMLDVILERVEDEGVMGSLSIAGEALQDRTAIIGLFAHVISRTPHVAPYWNGRTYLALPATVIPRALWPDKPEKSLGQTFGHTYRLLDPQDKVTSVNCPQIIELYMNFGVYGVLLGMMLFGFLYRVIVRWWSVPGADDGTLLVGAMLISRLFSVESDATLVWGTVLQAGILLFFVFRFLGARE